MSTLSSILNIGRGALQAQQKAISVTGNNIANVNTPGYTRQRADLVNGEAISDTPGQMGGGVKVAAVQRMYDRFITGEIRGESQELGEWEARSQIQDRLEIVFNEAEDDGLNKTMHEFWNAWQDLTSNPAGSVERSNLISRSQDMADRFRGMAADLDSIAAEVEGRIGQAVVDINEAAQKIARLNDSIRRAENLGQEPNDLKDQRDEALKALSRLADVSTVEDGSVIDVTLGGRTLVEGGVSWDLSYDGADFATTDPDSGTVWPIAHEDITSGTLGGLLTMKNDVIPDYKNRLDELAGEIIDAVNTQHVAGKDLYGNNPADIFFDAASANPAADMSVNQAVIDDHNLIAAAGGSEAIPGGGGNALAIADLAYQPLMNGNTENFSDFYTGLVADVGNDTRGANSRRDLQQTTMMQLEAYREEISGVSLDEEMVNLVQFQNAYAAAAKLISATDELLDTLINMV
jgi:flagellar hook-associated protein 1 FlgK